MEDVFSERNVHAVTDKIFKFKPFRHVKTCFGYNINASPVAK
jgi:hypothetical protein